MTRDDVTQDKNDVSVAVTNFAPYMAFYQLIIKFKPFLASEYLMSSRDNESRSHVEVPARTTLLRPLLLSRMDEATTAQWSPWRRLEWSGGVWIAVFCC